MPAAGGAGGALAGRLAAEHFGIPATGAGLAALAVLLLVWQARLSALRRKQKRLRMEESARRRREFIAEQNADRETPGRLPRTGRLPPGGA